MDKEGKYVYCIVGTKQERNFGPVGLGGRGDEVLTIGYNDLSMVVSNHPMSRFVVNRENMLTHEKIIEEVMREFDSVLPVRFGTVAASADEVRNLLDRRARELKDLLKHVDHKVELGVKGMWRNMTAIFKEIVEENRGIKKARREIQNGADLQTKMEVGRIVHSALMTKKDKEAERIVDALRRTSVDHRLNKTIGEEMFINAAFLVDKGREKEFDNIMDDLGRRHEDRTKFIYAGPLPVFSFVNIVIYPEEWEK